jgi:hypothetical protein
MPYSAHWIETNETFNAFVIPRSEAPRACPELPGEGNLLLLIPADTGTNLKQVPTTDGL